MKPKREMLDFNLMLVFYLQGEQVARNGWEKPINRESGYFFTQNDQQAHDWMVVGEEEND